MLGVVEQASRGIECCQPAVVEGSSHQAVHGLYTTTPLSIHVHFIHFTKYLKYFHIFEFVL